MDKELTFEDRLNRFIEATEKSSAEFDRKMAEFDRSMAESRAEDANRTAEFDRKMAESRAEFDRKIAESRAEFTQSLAESRAEFTQSLAESREEFNRSIAESRAEFNRSKAEFDKRAKELHTEIFGVAQNIGHQAEQYFQNALKNNMVFGGEQYDKMLPNLKYQGRETCEFDIVLVNGSSVALIEAKNRIHPKFVGEMVKTKAAQFRRHFPEYKNYKLYLGIAGFSFDGSVVEEAQEYGVGILRQDGDAAAESDTENLKAY